MAGADFFSFGALEAFSGFDSVLVALESDVLVDFDSPELVELVLLAESPEDAEPLESPDFPEPEPEPEPEPAPELADLPDDALSVL